MIRSLRENVWEQEDVFGVGVSSKSLLLIVNKAIYTKSKGYHYFLQSSSTH